MGTQAQRAIRNLSEGKDAIIHNDYGDIEYNIGRTGKIRPSGKIKGGVGLMHIVYARMAKDGASLEEALHIAMLVADALENGKEVDVIGNKHYYRKGEVEAIFAINSDNSKPVLTGYKIGAVESDGAIPTSSDLLTFPPPRKEDVVSALANILAKMSAPRQGGISADDRRYSIGGVFAGVVAPLVATSPGYVQQAANIDIQVVDDKVAASRCKARAVSATTAQRKASGFSAH